MCESTIKFNEWREDIMWPESQIFEQDVLFIRCELSWKGKHFAFQCPVYDEDPQMVEDAKELLKLACEKSKEEYANERAM